MLWRVPVGADLRLKLKIDRASKHSDLKRTTLYRNAHFDARKWGGALTAPSRGPYLVIYGRVDSG